MNLTGVHLGSYWMGENDVVYLMAQELKNKGHTELVDTKIYDNSTGNWYSEELRPGHTYPIRWINHNKLVKLVGKLKPNYVVLNAGGMAITEQTKEWLSNRRVVCVGIELSDPDVFADNGQIYGDNFDLFYTNSLHSLKRQYPQSSKYRHLPFAASPSLHKPLRKVSKQYDVVVVGHARPERIEIVSALREYFSVKTYGSGWDQSSNEVHGLDHTRAINSGRIYLSFSQTYAGYNNVKVGLFEAAACRTCIVTSFNTEMAPLFTYGVDVVGYHSEEDLIRTVQYCLLHPQYQEWIAENSYRRVLKEHTWEKRWENILKDIYEIRS